MILIWKKNGAVLIAIKGFCKVKKKKKTRIELTPPTHPTIQTFLGNPSLTWTEHWNHNTVETLFYDHPQNQIGVVVNQGWSSTRGLNIL